jgi:hypothetical protein
MNQALLVLSTLAGSFAQFDGCGGVLRSSAVSSTDCADAASCYGYPPGFSGFNWANINYGDCPTASGGTVTYFDSYTDCLQTSVFHSCIFDGWNKIQANSYWVLNNHFQWADENVICDQVECEAYALWADCLREAYKNDGVNCPTDYSLCMAEECKPATGFGTKEVGSACASDTECNTGYCAGVCVNPWPGSTCYNRHLSPSDSAQWAGCQASSADTTYTSQLPSPTWRVLRGDADTQKELCDRINGRMDTIPYEMARIAPSPQTPHTIAYTEPVCISTGFGFGSSVLVEQDVAATYFEEVCSNHDALISILTDHDVAVDVETQEACYAARDQANGWGIGVGQKCYASCDPSSAVQFTALLLWSLF